MAPQRITGPNSGANQLIHVSDTSVFLDNISKKRWFQHSVFQAKSCSEVIVIIVMRAFSVLGAAYAGLKDLTRWVIVLGPFSAAIAGTRFWLTNLVAACAFPIIAAATLPFGYVPGHHVFPFYKDRLQPISQAYREVASIYRSDITAIALIRQLRQNGFNIHTELMLTAALANNSAIIKAIEFTDSYATSPSFWATRVMELAVASKQKNVITILSTALEDIGRILLQNQLRESIQSFDEESIDLLLECDADPCLPISDPGYMQISPYGYKKISPFEYLILGVDEQNQLSGNRPIAKMIAVAKKCLAKSVTAFEKREFRAVQKFRDRIISINFTNGWHQELITDDVANVLKEGIKTEDPYFLMLTMCWNRGPNVGPNFMTPLLRRVSEIEPYLTELQNAHEEGYVNGRIDTVMDVCQTLPKVAVAIILRYTAYSAFVPHAVAEVTEIPTTPVNFPGHDADA